MRIRKKPAPISKQIATANKWLDDYFNTENDKIRENILNIFIEDYRRNFYNDKMFSYISVLIEMYDNNEEGEIRF